MLSDFYFIFPSFARAYVRTCVRTYVAPINEILLAKRVQNFPKPEL